MLEITYSKALVESLNLINIELDEMGELEESVQMFPANLKKRESLESVALNIERTLYELKKVN